MKKKESFFKNPMVITGIIALFGAMGTGIVTLAGYITLPNRVEAVEQKTESIEDYIKEQRVQNDMMQKIYQQQQPQQLEPIISRDGKWFWDEQDKEWKPIKELQERGK